LGFPDVTSTARLIVRTGHQSDLLLLHTYAHIVFHIQGSHFIVVHSHFSLSPQLGVYRNQILGDKDRNRRLRDYVNDRKYGESSLGLRTLSSCGI
jgi:hypothetical protein